MKLVLSLLLLILVSVFAFAQTPVAVKAPAIAGIAQPSAEQKANLTNLAKSWEKKAIEADSAKDKYIIALLAIQNELGLKSSETAVDWNEKGEPVFRHVPPTVKPAATP